MTTEDFFKVKEEYIQKLRPDREIKSLEVLKLENIISNLNEDIDTLNLKLDTKVKEFNELQDRLELEAMLKEQYYTENEGLKDKLDKLSTKNTYLNSDINSLKSELYLYKDKLFRLRCYFAGIIGIIFLVTFTYKFITKIF